MPVSYDRPTIYDEGKPIPASWDLRCTDCGYSLTGLASRRCPECGRPFDPRRTWEANQEARLQTGIERLPPRVSGFLHVTECVVLAALTLACFAMGLFHNRGAWLAVLIVVLVEANIRIARAEPLRYRLLGIVCCVVIGGLAWWY